MVSRTMIFVAVATCVASIAATTCDGKDGACQIGTNQLLQMDQTNLIGENRALRGQDDDADDAIPEACRDVDDMYPKCEASGALECHVDGAFNTKCLCERTGCPYSAIIGFCQANVAMCPQCHKFLEMPAPNWEKIKCQATPTIVGTKEKGKDIESGLKIIASSLDMYNYDNTVIDVVGREDAVDDFMKRIGAQPAGDQTAGPPPPTPTIVDTFPMGEVITSILDMSNDGTIDIEVVGKEWAVKDLMNRIGAQKAQKS